MSSQPDIPLPRITVVVLAYNSATFMQGCLDALYRSRAVDLEIICVDNASRDDSHAIAQAHPATTRAVRLEENRGYAGGNNVGWRIGTAPLVVFINPDCHVVPDTLANLVRPLVEEDTIGICGALLYYPNSTEIQHAGGFLHPNAMPEHYGIKPEHGTDWFNTKDVSYVTGALIAFRRADLEELGGFDEEYWPAYFEEADLCWRMRKRGKRVRYVAEAVGYHHESPGLTKNSLRFVRTMYRSRMVFLVKNFTLQDFVTRFIPFEVKWFFGPFARGFRFETLRSYGVGFIFALRCLGRFSRRGRPRPLPESLRQ